MASAAALVVKTANAQTKINAPAKNMAASGMLENLAAIQIFIAVVPAAIPAKAAVAEAAIRATLVIPAIMAPAALLYRARLLIQAPAHG
jgi:hypothetical protein